MKFILFIVYDTSIQKKLCKRNGILNKISEIRSDIPFFVDLQKIIDDLREKSIKFYLCYRGKNIEVFKEKN